MPTKPKNLTHRLPAASIELKGDGGFSIRIQDLRKQLLMDQSGDVLTAAGQGCISSPGGPRC